MMIATHSLPRCLAVVLFCHALSANALFTNSTITTTAFSVGHGTTEVHNGTDALGDVLTCAGRTPPPGLSFPIETVVEKLTSVSGPTTDSYQFGNEAGQWTAVPFTAAGPTTIYTTFTRQQRPQYVPDGGDGLYPKCCGQCTVYFSMVDVMYWPVPGANTACLNSESGSNHQITSPATIPPSNNSISTTVGPDGFTYTSPSIYLAYHDISASDLCGQVGPKHTSITLSFEPGQLSTIEYAPGIFEGPGAPMPKSFDLKNLPCPPQSLLDAQEAANQPGLSLPQRGTYAPIIAPPPYLQSLEPEWKSCISFYAFDPPRTLAPASALAPSPTPKAQVDPEITSAKPGPTISTPAVPTTSILADSPIVPFDPKASGDPAVPWDPVVPNIPNDPKTSQENPADPSLTQGSTVSPAVSVKPPNSAETAEPHDPPKTTLPNPSKHQSSPDPGVSSAPKDPVVVPSKETLSAPNAQNVNQPQGHTPESPSPAVLAIGSHTLTALSSGGFAIADSTIKPHSPAVTVNGVPISLDSTALVAGSSTIHLPSSNPTGSLIAAGHTIKPLGPSSIAIADKTVSIDGPAATISGTPISLALAGLAIGSQTFAIPAPSSHSNLDFNANNVFTLASQAYTQLGTSSIAVASTTLAVGGPQATISGTPISLAALGIVVAGQTHSIPTPFPNSDTTPLPSSDGMNSVITVADKPFTPLGPSSIAVAGTTLAVGGPQATISGTPISLAASGIVVAGQTHSIPTPFPNSETTTLPSSDGMNSVITVADKPFTPLGPSSIAVAGTTLYINGPAATISGTPISLASSALIIASHIYPLPTGAPVSGATIQIEGSALSAGGPAMTIAGTPLSLAIGANGPYITALASGSGAFSAAVTAGETISTNKAGRLAANGAIVTAEDGGLGSAIMAGFGSGGTATGSGEAATGSGGAATGGGSASSNTTAGVEGFTGRAGRLGGGSVAKLLGVMGMMWFGL